MNCTKSIFLFGCLIFFFLGVIVANAKIVYSIEGDIYISNDDGSNRRRLTRNPDVWEHGKRDFYPCWSPDGRKIAFVRQMVESSPPTKELFVMTADGTDLQQLTHNHITDSKPSWSPDGNKIVFQRKVKETGKTEVHTIELATLTITQLTGNNRKEDDLSSVAPDWSPDGTKILYEKFINVIDVGFSPKNIYVMSATGENQRPVFPDPKPDDKLSMRFFPKWSSDGKQFVFNDCTGIGKNQRCRVTVAGLTGRKQVIQDIYDKLGDKLLTGVCWMDNDRALLLDIMSLDKPNPNYDLYRYEFKTGSIRRLTHDPRNEETPHWIEGALSVTPIGKKNEKWGKIKQ